MKDQIIQEYYRLKRPENFKSAKNVILVEIAKNLNTNKDLVYNTLKKEGIDYSELTETEKEIIVNTMLKVYSIVEIGKIYKLWNRSQVEKTLIEYNIHPKYNKEISKKCKEYQTNRIRKTCMDRYGVKNIGKTGKYGWCALNKLNYEKPKYLSEQKEYSEIVYANTVKPEPVKYCEYTGIAFAEEPCNPNHPLKRSIDHSISIQYGYLMGLDPSEIYSPKNIKQCLKCVNSIKAQTNLNDFIPLAKKLREKLINENYEYNPDFQITTV